MRRTVLTETLLFATIGFVIELAIVLLIGFGRVSDGFILPVAVSVLGLYLSAAVLGNLFGKRIERKGRDIKGVVLTCILIAWVTLMVQVLFGSSVEFLKNIRHSGAFIDYIFKPFFWVLFLGSVPSVIIGIVYSFRIQKHINRIPV